MRNFTKNFIWAVVTIVVVALVFSFVNSVSNPPKTISLNDLASKIASGEVKDIQVSGENLGITLQDGSKLTAKKEDNASVTDTFKNLGVDPAALQKVNLEVVGQSTASLWASALLPTILPILLIGFLFWFMFRQARTGANAGIQLRPLRHQARRHRQREIHVQRRRGLEGSEGGARRNRGLFEKS
jgi:ATP-dependent Zn protease